MYLVKSILAEMFSLFVDDGHLASQVLGLVAVVTAMAKLAEIDALIAAATLLAGCAIILIASVLRRARK